jgi:NTP pyrophosphatase (non-canonical NTP hydrolase)
VSDTATTLQNLKDLVEQFTKERDWQKFHTPKNVSMALAGEVTELMEFFWCENNESFKVTERNLEKIKHEVADIACYLLIFCNRTGIDLSQAITEKIKLNTQKYPIELCKGKSDKYTTYQTLKKS